MINPYVPTPAKIEDIRVETEDTKTFTLGLADNRIAETVKPGQFIVIGALGVGEAPISVCSPPGSPQLQVSIRNIGSVTNALHEARVGDILHVRGPYGNGWPMEKAIGNDLLLVGGGIGLAPLRPVALSHSNARKILLCYGARIPQLLMYMDEFPNWNADGVEVELTVDKPAEGWNGNVGVVTKLLEKHDFDPERTVVFICGPSIMMKFSVRTLLSKGINGQNIFVSLESKMRCGIGKCGHCHFGSKHVCVDGPVFSLKDALDSSNELISV